MHPAVVAIKNRKDAIPTTSAPIRTLKLLSMTVVFLCTGVLVNILQILTSPIRLVSMPLTFKLNSFFTWFGWKCCQYFLVEQDNVNLTVSGDDSVPDQESAYVISNHAFFGDFFLMHVLSERKKMMGSCKYFLKDSIKYIPIFGWGVYFADMPFLKRNWQTDSGTMKKALSNLIDNQINCWLISYVEGSRLTAVKLQQSHEFARKQGLFKPKNLLLPRCKGFEATVDALRDSHIQHFYDVTIAFYHDKRGFGATPSVFEILLGRLGDFQMHIHIDRMPLSAVPSENCDTWLYSLFEKKDALLEAIKEVFETRSNKKRA